MFNTLKYEKKKILVYHCTGTYFLVLIVVFPLHQKRAALEHCF